MGSVVDKADLERAADRIRAYHAHQRDPGFRYEEDGVVLGQEAVASAPFHWSMFLRPAAWL